jgi:ATP-dependent Clp protease ATP-binding subunit ClpA
MFERFDTRSRSVVVRARKEARMSGAARLEAEHLLLALSRQAESDAARVLAEAGLDHDGVRDALDAELRRSLENAGIALGGLSVDEPPLPAAGEPAWGASAKRALERALIAAKERGDRRILPGHILLGLLRADEGTVPRALALGGVDPDVLAAAIEAALDRAP